MEIFATHGFPKSLVLLNGSSFTSTEFRRSLSSSYQYITCTRSRYFEERNQENGEREYEESYEHIPCLLLYKSFTIQQVVHLLN